MLASVFFVLGFTTVFVGLGAGASVFGQLIQTYKSELSIVAGLVIILFGLHFLGVCCAFRCSTARRAITPTCRARA